MSRPLRVLLVSANFRPSVGGIERFVEILAEGMATRGHEVTVLCCRSRSAPRWEHANGVDIVRIPAAETLHARLNVPYPLPEPRALRSTLKGLLAHADVLHAQDAIYVTSVAALSLSRRARVPSILTQHVGFVPQKNLLLNLLQHAAIQTIGRAARLASVVTTVNPTVGEWAVRTWGLRDVQVLPVGVPKTPVSEADRLAVRRELGLDEDAFVALFTGRDVPKKRLDVFLGAADPAYELVAVTDRAGNRGRHARIVPFMSSDRFARLLAAADAFVLPSEGEGLPMALQEALVAGVPCVVTREPGYERYLHDGDVVYVEPEPEFVRDTLRRLAASSAEHEELARRAREAGERSFGVNAFVSAYEEIYRRPRSQYE